jgi:hypothetical protein
VPLTPRAVCLLVGLATFAAVGMKAQEADATKSVGFFYNPSRTIECRFSNAAVACASFRSAKVAVLNPMIVAQTVTVTRFGNMNPECKVPPGDDVPCWFQPGGRGPALAFGASATDPDAHIYRCSSLTSGVVCRSLLSGRGFKISQSRVMRLAAVKHR